MSLSRPVKFPLLKLPFLCIKCVLHNSDQFEIIYFASISNRTRRIVKSSNYPLKEIDISLNRSRKIRMGNRRNWYFMDQMRGNGVPLVLRKNTPSFLTRSGLESCGGHYLKSYTSGDTVDALKMGINFLIDVFGCSVKYIITAGNNLSHVFGLNIRSVEKLHISDFTPVNIPDLKHFLETIKVTDEYVFFVPIPEDFSCDPQIFKCRELFFGGENSADWVTLEILCQLDVSMMTFRNHRFSKEDIVSYITYWSNSENRKLKYLFVCFQNPISQEDFKIDHLNPMPFCEKRRDRCVSIEGWGVRDISSGMDIIRNDGLLATFFVKSTYILFYIWHERFPDTV